MGNWLHLVASCPSSYQVEADEAVVDFRGHGIVLVPALLDAVEVQIGGVVDEDLWGRSCLVVASRRMVVVWGCSPGGLVVAGLAHRRALLACLVVLESVDCMAVVDVDDAVGGAGAGGGVVDTVGWGSERCCIGSAELAVFPTRLGLEAFLLMEKQK